MSDPRKANDLDEAARNDDGTWNAFRALSWLSEVLNPGKGISEDVIRSDVERERKKRAI